MMEFADNRIVGLFVEPEGPLITGSVPFEWTPLVFSSLKTLCQEGTFRIYLLSDEPEGEVVRHLIRVLQEQGIIIEEAVPSVLAVPMLDRARSCIVGTQEAAQGVRRIAFTDWPTVLKLLGTASELPPRRARIERNTQETRIKMAIDLDGTGKSSIDSGLPFFDHMLQQVARHGKIDIQLRCEGELEVDEHHTVEDIAIVFGQAVLQALGDKRGIGRYGFEILPMDECLAQVALDFSGRSWFAWDVSFSRDVIGTFPTELFSHFFKSFSDESRCNLHMQVNAGNAHHQAEALFKAFGRAVRRAVFRYPGNLELPSTKGVL